MTESPEGMLQKAASDIRSENELKALVYHQDYVYKNNIRPVLEALETTGKEKAVDQFDHYYQVNRKIIAYLWKELIIAKNPKLKEVEEDEEK
jgi:hypothetical protein